eukprot:scaffold1984_cov162-Amphora_coffeaeformis.AAC.3
MWLIAVVVDDVVEDVVLCSMAAAALGLAWTSSAEIRCWDKIFQICSAWISPAVRAGRRVSHKWAASNS